MQSPQHHQPQHQPEHQPQPQLQPLQPQLVLLENAGVTSTLLHTTCGVKQIVRWGIAPVRCVLATRLLHIWCVRGVVRFLAVLQWHIGVPEIAVSITVPLPIVLVCGCKLDDFV